MEFPDWLKPSPVSVLLALVLFGAVSQLSAATSFLTDYTATGFPLAFEEAWGPCPPGGTCQSFNPVYLAVDVLAWYLFTSAAVYSARKK